MVLSFSDVPKKKSTQKATKAFLLFNNFLQLRYIVRVFELIKYLPSTIVKDFSRRQDKWAFKIVNTLISQLTVETDVISLINKLIFTQFHFHIT
jgi:hypothetical protein